MRTVLNVGCGHPDHSAGLPSYFKNEGWRELRLDIDPWNNPDVIGSMLDMSAVPDGSVAAVYSSHSIEHLYANEVAVALKEFLRVLSPDGFAIVSCPDLQAAAELIAKDKLLDVAYESPGGTVTPFDLVFGHRAYAVRDNPFQSHHSGFTLKILTTTLRQAGFGTVGGLRRLQRYDLSVIASKSNLQEHEMRELAESILSEPATQ
ncbi:methyltransferase domain-containing protein [Allochromatium humboldtianum]|uniref:Methyltransferase domain-containing protein n=1 Tax=Allochromatium humboldtianum TaxID=504901 RepID=A0A850RG15_9GAMM|nr:methyltransferase domain-containing protein [Allochromatium humboldtianum]